MTIWLAIAIPLSVCWIVWMLTKETRRECYLGCCVPNSHRYTSINEYNY